MMKKKLVYLLTAAVLVTGCGAGQKTEGGEAAAVSGNTAGESVYTDSIQKERLTHPVSDKTFSEAPISEFIELGDYKGLAPAVTEEGSSLEIAYEGTIDGEAVEGMSTESTELTLGSDTYIPGFEDALIGYHEGDVVEFDLAFPDPYTANEELSGKTGHWTVTILDIKNEGYQMLSSVIKASTFKAYPRDEFERFSDYIYRFYRDAAGNDYDMSLADLVREYKIDMTAETDECLQNILTAEAIMNAEGLTRESEEYVNELNSVLEVNDAATVEEAVKAGIPEEWLDLTATRRVAYQILHQYMSSTDKE